MKYIDALRKYNEGKDKWCVPRKGTEDYVKIRNMMNMKGTRKLQNKRLDSAQQNKKESIAFIKS
jgi:hypothetical protein